MDAHGRRGHPAALSGRADELVALANLTRYTKEHGAFLATATGLPKLAVQNDLSDACSS